MHKIYVDEHDRGHDHVRIWVDGIGLRFQVVSEKPFEVRFDRNRTMAFCRNTWVNPRALRRAAGIAYQEILLYRRTHSEHDDVAKREAALTEAAEIRQALEFIHMQHQANEDICPID